MNESILYAGIALTGIAIILIWAGVIFGRPKPGIDPYRQPYTQPPAVAPVTPPVDDSSSGDGVPGEKGGRRRFDN